MKRDKIPVATDTAIRPLLSVSMGNDDQDDEELAELEKSKAAVTAEMDEIQRKATEIAQKEKQRKDKKRQQLLAQYEELMSDARDYRADAARTDDTDEKKRLYDIARDCEKAAITIAPELGIKVEPEEKPTPKFWQRPKVHAWAAAGQIVLLIVTVVYCFGMFGEFRDRMVAQNQAVKIQAERTGATAELLNPYDDTAFQKYAFESFVEFMDLPKALLKLLILAPFLIFYLYKGFLKDFFEGLTPFQRCVIIVITIGFLLLHSGFSHLVKAD